MYVYKITNNINKKIYIGITNNYKKRWSNHKSGNSKNMVIGKAIEKYGIENFTFEILFSSLSLEEANNKEIELIKEYNCRVPNGYNVSFGGGAIDGVSRYGADNSHAKLTEEQAQYILDHRDIPMYVLYEQFNEIISYSAFKEVYHHHTYTNLNTNTPIYPYNIEFSAQFTSGGKLDYDDIVLLREKYAEGIYWEEVYQNYKSLYPDKWTFWNIYVGNKYKLVMPEVFTEKNKHLHHSLGHSGEKNGKSKLTENDVRRIRELHKEGKTNKEIHELFPQVTTTSIRNIVNGKTWKTLI
nr:MAG TPA_asm: intron associated endonuclease [Caudoviricetes sp.]